MFQQNNANLILPLQQEVYPIILPGQSNETKQNETTQEENKCSHTNDSFSV